MVRRIGSLVVVLDGVPFPELRGLAEAPAGMGVREPAADPVSVSFRRVPEAVWPRACMWSDGTYRKGLPGHRIVLDLAARQVRFEVVSGAGPGEWYYIFRDLFCALGAWSGDPLLHASAVLADGKAWVFCGSSGTGKSTAARLLRERGRLVVNDEINWITVDAEGVVSLVNQRHWVFPPAGGTPDPLVPVGGIFILEQSPLCRTAELASSEAFPHLLGAPYGGEDPFLAKRARTTADLLKRFPVRKLEFCLDGGGIEQAVGISAE